MRLALLLSIFAFLLIEPLWAIQGNSLCVQKQLQALVQNGAVAVPPHLNDYEIMGRLNATPTKKLEEFEARQGIRVTRRSPEGVAMEGEIRILGGTPKDKIYVIGDFNDWGKTLTPEDQLTNIKGTTYFQGQLRKLQHGMPYRIQVNGQAVFAPASDTLSTAGLMKKLTGKEDYHLNSIFWDFDHPGHFTPTVPRVDLRGKPRVGAEADVDAFVKKWEFQGRMGPASEEDTYRFIAESGVIQKMKDWGYNVVRFSPFQSSLDGTSWQFRYLSLTQYGPDSRFGTPEEFMKMIDAFHREGIAVQMDVVAAHFPKFGNPEGSIREIKDSGMHIWKDSQGKQIYGRYPTHWDTWYYHFFDKNVRDYLTDGILTMIKRYNVDSLRIDHLDGILHAAGGRDFTKELVKELRAYRPDISIEGEVFEHHNGLLKSLEKDGVGIDLRIHGEMTVFLRNSLDQMTEHVNMEDLQAALQKPFLDSEPFRAVAFSTHDEAANPIWGASGSYPHNILQNAGDSIATRKIQAYSSLAMFSGSNYVDLPQVLLKQKGNFTHQPEIDFALLKKKDVTQNAQFFSDRNRYFTSSDASTAFAPQNLSSSMQNHIDAENKVVSLLRKDTASGKEVYVIINLGHKELTNYPIGVERAGQYKVALDNDAAQYGGKGILEKATMGATLKTTKKSANGKPSSVKLPVLGPWQVIVLEAQ